MEYIGAEVSHKIRSAIKAKLMELGAYVDEELPDYIMVMVANKRQKAQMDGDLQLFLGSNTSQFTSWLYQVLQKLQEVTVGNLDKKSTKVSSSVMKDNTIAKRKSSSLDSDSHRKEKRRKSSESRKSKKTDIDVLRDNKKNSEGVIKLSSRDSEQPETKFSKSKEFVSSSRPDNSDSVVSSSADSKINKKLLMREKVEKTQDSDIIRRNSVKSLSNGSSKSEEKTYLSRLRADALRSRDDRLVSLKSPGTSDDHVSIVSSKGGAEVKVAGSKIIYGQSQRSKIVLMNSDDEDDDEDFINIKADAEAEQLLKEELPRDALETCVGTPETVQAVVEPSGSQKKVPEGPALPPELPTIPLKENLVPKRPFVKEALVAPNPQPSVTPMPAVPLNLPLPTVPISTRILRKRNVDTEVEAVQAKLSKDEERPVGSALSVKDRLGVKKSAAAVVVETKASARLGARPVAPEQRVTVSQAELKQVSNTVAKRASANTNLLSRVITLHNRPRPERREHGLETKMIKQEVNGDEEEEEEYDPSNPAVGTVASIVRVKPRPKLPASLQANKTLILKAVAEAQKSVANTPIRADPSRPGGLWKRTSAGFVRKVEGNVGITLPNRHLQSFKDEPEPEAEEEEDEEDDDDDDDDDEEEEEDIKPDSTRLVTSGNGHDKIIIKVSSTKPEKGQEVVESNEEISDDENADNILQYQEEEPSANEDAEMRSTGRAVYPPVGLASRMPRERSNQIQSQQYTSPQFLVTLDGLDPDMFGLRSSSLEEQATSKEDFDLENVESSGSLDNDTPKKAKTPIVYKVESTAEDSSESTLPKSLERCKYWPSCRLGGKCNFHHPVTPCKTFPKCPFGDKCLYVHPFCKFNSACTRRDCPFVHAAPRTLVLPVPRLTVVPKTTFAPICRFFPKCTNVSCKFLHPKACRYGRFCSKQDCSFIHQDLPSMDKLKWTSPFKT